MLGIWIILVHLSSDLYWDLSTYDSNSTEFSLQGVLWRFKNGVVSTGWNMVSRHGIGVKSIWRCVSAPDVFLELLSSDILIVKILESQKPNNLEVFGGKESKGSHMGPHYDTHLVLTSSLFTSSRTLINLLTLVVNRTDCTNKYTSNHRSVNTALHRQGSVEV